MDSYRIKAMEKIFLLVGTNVGDVKSNLIQANREIEQHGIRIIKKSRMQRTKPVGKTDQPDFLNQVLEVSCNLTPDELLSTVKEIEEKMGRTPGPRWGPRLIDIDILFFGSKIIDTPCLTIPHKEFYRRPFAVELVAEIAPDFVTPDRKKSIHKHWLEIHSEKSAVSCN
jgi:2-amino-4-hydroxy-6-hydroxymethyldihydropteridine diphosphokinase